MTRGEARRGGTGGQAPSLSDAQQRAVESVLKGQAGTRYYMTETDAQFSLPGAAQKASAVAYGDTPSSSGIPLISGRWYSASPGAAEVDVNTLFLTDTGTSVGSTYTLISGPHRLTFRIVGAVFKTGSQADLYLSPAMLSRLDPGAQPQHFDVALQPGTSAQAYTNTVSAALGHSYRATSSQASTTQFLAVLTLITMLTVLITVVAGLGVLNTVALQIRERAHDIGVHKAIGMTPRQTLSMVVCSVPGVGLVAGIVGVPAGVFLHHAVVPVMAHAANSGHSQSLLSVYSPVGADPAGTRRVGHRDRRRARPCRLGGESRNGKLPARRIDSRGGARAGPQGARPPALTCRHEAEKEWWPRPTTLVRCEPVRTGRPTCWGNRGEQVWPTFEHGEGKFKALAAIP
ncbi:ABC transporter permease [Streptomyces sp. NPDC002550]